MIDSECRSEHRRELEDFLRQGTESGRFRACAHISIFPETASISDYFLICREDYFEGGACYQAGGRRVRKTPACPTACRRFKDPEEEKRAAAEQAKAKADAAARAEAAARKEEKRRRWREWGSAPLRWIAGFFVWLAHAPWQTQFLVFLFLILVFAPHWMRPLAELVRAFWGK